MLILNNNISDYFLSIVQIANNKKSSIYYITNSKKNKSKIIVK